MYRNGKNGTAILLNVSPELVAEAVYGLPEMNRDEVTDAHYCQIQDVTQLRYNWDFS